VVRVAENEGFPATVHAETLCETVDNFIVSSALSRDYRLHLSAAKRVVFAARGGRNSRVRSLFLNFYHWDSRRTTKSRGDSPRLCHRDLTKRIIALAIEVHPHTDPGLLESSYATALPRAGACRYSGPARSRHSSAPQRGTNSARLPRRYAGGRDCHPGTRQSLAGIHP
jgi:hypothetical protein